MSLQKQESMQKENKMGVMPVKRLIITMSLPMMVSMLVQALYNIVDSIFVSQINEQLVAVGSGTGVGINALLSKSLGEKKIDRADAAANTGLLLIFFSYLVFLLIGIFGMELFFNTQTSDPQFVDYGISYLRIVCCLGFGMLFQMTFERLLQSTGMTVYSMISQMSGAIFNIIFDPILIFGYFGFPRLGVAGAAYATVFGQMLGASIGLILNLKKNKEIHFSISKILHPDLETIKRIYFVGVPSILMISIGSVMSYLMNRILNGFSSTATAVYGVYFKLQSFFFMPVFGLNNGLVPIVAYNYGAQHKRRMLDVTRVATIVAVILLVAGTIAFWVIPDKLLAIFNASENMLSIGVPALRAISLSFPLAAYNIIRGSVMQALGSAVNSMIVSLARQLFVLLPSAMILAVIFREQGGLPAVWYSYVIAEIVALIMTFLFYRKVRRDKIEPLPE